MLHTGVDRRRPADADKAYNNLRNLIAAVLSLAIIWAVRVLVACRTPTSSQRPKFVDRPTQAEMRSDSTRVATPAASGSGSGSAWTMTRRWVGRVRAT